MAVCVGATVIFELEKVLSPDIPSFLAALRSQIFWVTGLLTALLVFIRFYFGYRADILFSLALLVWVGSNAYQLAVFPDAFFNEISDLVPGQTRWGEDYFKLRASVTSAKLVTDVGSLLVLAYIVGAAFDSWKRGEKKQAIVVGGGSAGFMLVAGILVPLDDVGAISITMPVGISFLGLMAALTYQLIDDQVRANTLRFEVERLRRSSLAGEIVAGLMHELRQPLTSILSNSQAARRFLDADAPDLDEVREALDDVVAEDKRAADIISGLRNLLGQEPLVTSQFDVNATARRVASMLAGEFHTSGTRIALSLSSTPVRVNASEVQIEQVLFNLTINALRALRTEARQSRIVRLTVVQRDERVELSVSDSGPGIAKAIEPRLFEPFASGGDGLGMGLAICRRIVTNHGGRLWVEDSELGGARFVVALPLSNPGNANE